MTAARKPHVHPTPSAASKIIAAGSVFERLTVVGVHDVVKQKRRYLVKCVCGNTRVVWGHGLKSGTTRSCGCLQRELAVARATSHGMHSHPLYSTWDGILQRCRNPKASNYYLYGGRGISVCERWLSVANFAADVPVKPGPDFELDRIDNSGNYEPGNVRWVTRKENARNMRTNQWVLHNGRQRLLIEVSEELGFHPEVIRTRIKRGDADLFRPLKQGQRDAKKLPPNLNAVTPCSGAAAHELRKQTDVILGEVGK